MCCERLETARETGQGRSSPRQRMPQLRRCVEGAAAARGSDWTRQDRRLAATCSSKIAEPPATLPAGLHASTRSWSSCCTAPRRAGRERQGHRLGLRRDAGAGQPAAGRHADPLHRPGRRSAAPSATATRCCTITTPGEHVRPAATTSIRQAGASSPIMNTMLSRAGGARFRVRLQLRPTRATWCLGSAVRRFRQRRPADHRPVHRRRREQVAADERPGDAAAARLRRARARSTPTRTSSGSCRCAPRTTCRCACRRTPAQYFHLLRRQMHRKFRKPLVLMMPKSLLRLEPTVGRSSRSSPIGLPARARRPANARERDRVRRVLFCSGKVFYTLSRRATRPRREATSRSSASSSSIRSRQGDAGGPGEVPQAREICWVQEEPQNRGAWRSWKTGCATCSRTRRC